MVDAYGIKGRTQFALDEIVAPVAISLDLSASPYQSTPRGARVSVPHGLTIPTATEVQAHGIRPAANPISVLGFHLSGRIFATGPTPAVDAVPIVLWGQVFQNIASTSPGSLVERVAIDNQEPGIPGKIGIGPLVTYSRGAQAVGFRANQDTEIAGFDEGIWLGSKMVGPIEGAGTDDLFDLQWTFETPIHLWPQQPGQTELSTGKAMDTLYVSGPTGRLVDTVVGTAPWALDGFQFDDVTWECLVWQNPG